MRRRHLASMIAVVVLALATGGRARGQVSTTFFDGLAHPAIQYATRPLRDPIMLLARKIQDGTVRLDFDERTGYLPALLQALEIPVESQLAVMSKTSAQAQLIGPLNPRLIFFNDSVSVAWPRGGFIEIASHDPQQGVILYTVDQRASSGIVFNRPPLCLQCHVAYASLNVPGMLVRSVGTGGDGRTMPWLGNATPDHRTPMLERWAGWFVTGNSGTQRHLGNLTARSLDETTITPRASSLASLKDRVDAATYLTPYSDIAALLVFDHQMHMMNVDTRRLGGAHCGGRGQSRSGRHGSPRRA